MKLTQGNTSRSLRRTFTSLSSLLLSLALLAACGGKATPTATPAPVTETPVGTPTSTPLPPRSLTVCLGQEPASLFPVDNPSASARSILAAVYEGPIETNSYGYQPVILKDLPTLANGDAQLFKQSVYVGDEVVDATDTPVTLAVGTQVRPSGCRDNSCAIEYDGKSAIMMDQMQVTFRLLDGLTWSDGLPLTAADSVFAYSLDADPAVAGSKYLVNRTKSYEAAGDTVVQWWGKPGYIDTTYLANFWAPLPQHLWGKISADQLAEDPISSHTPVGWGPYVIQEWVPGDHISLIKNTHYFRSAEGLPKFTKLNFRFIQDPAAAVSDLISGACDILDPSINLDGQVDLLNSMAAKKQVQALFSASPVMEQLAFGIRPASYDNGATTLRRPDFLGDVRVRRAVAMCIDRKKVSDTVLHGLSPVPVSFVPEDDPLFNPAAASYAFDVSAANALLEQAGWRDVDKVASTPRQAWGLKDIPSGTPLVLNYVTTQATQRVQVSTMIADSLAQCGIKVNVKFLDQASLYAAGPDGSIFGRNFDLSEFAMGSTGTEPPCEWFTSSEIPNAANRWVGTNVSGYSSPAFDAGCLAVQQSLIDEPAHADAYRQAQSIFATDLPVIPLYWRIRIAAARSDLCHYSLDPTASSAMWNITLFDAGTSCSQ